MSRSSSNTPKEPAKLKAPADLAKKQTGSYIKTTTPPPAPPTPPSNGGNGGGGDDRRLTKNGNPALVGAGIMLVILLILGVTTISVVKIIRSSGGVATTKVPQRTIVVTPPVVTPPVIQQGEWEQIPRTPRAAEPRGKEVAPVVDWRTDNGYLIPLRLMPDGRKAGYGVSYTYPPEGGGKLPSSEAIASAIKAKTAAWTRNERGDWAIKL